MREGRVCEAHKEGLPFIVKIVNWRNSFSTVSRGLAAKDLLGELLYCLLFSVCLTVIFIVEGARKSTSFL